MCAFGRKQEDLVGEHILFPNFVFESIEVAILFPDINERTKETPTE